jgi:acetyl-CoA acyltransferase
MLMSTRHAVIVDAVRTAGGKRNGKLSGWHPVDLASEVLRAVVDRNGLDPALVEDVIMGCVSQVGSQSMNIARCAALAADFPESVVGATLDRQCGSSQQAAHFAAQGVMAGAYDVVIAAGAEVMTTTPMGSTKTPGSYIYGPRLRARYKPQGGLISQGLSAELIADKWGLTREELDEYSVRSHQRAAAARDAGHFANEIVALPGRRTDKESGDIVVLDEIVADDEGIRGDTTLAGLSALKPSFKADGKITAGNSSQISDGASAMLIMGEDIAEKYGLRARARFHTFALAGVDPIMMLTGPIDATRKVLDRAGLTIDDIDRIEVNEAFAPVVLAWQREIKPDMDRVNVHGGAIALGHPLGASGAKLFATLLNQLERSNGRYGLLTMCEGGGMANATIIERLG